MDQPCGAVAAVPDEAGSYTMLSDTKCKYECELKESELPGAAISEIGLYDADGDIVTIKRFTAKGKDADISMTFYINDTF